MEIYTEALDIPCAALEEINQYGNFLLSFSFSPSFSLFPTYHAACPPSILRSAPVMKLLASLIRNTPAPRYSSGPLSLPSMFCVGQSVRRSGNCLNSSSTMAVTM